MTTVTEFVAGLRALADWYESHSEIRGPINGAHFISYAPTAEALAAGARALGSAKKSYDDPWIELTRDFGGGIELKIYSGLEEVCTRRVIGQRVVPARPMVTLPARPARVEDIIEWDCGPILAEIKPA